METRHSKQKALAAARSRLRPRSTADDNKPATDKSNTKPKPSRTKAGPQSKTAPRAKVGPRSKVPARPEQTDPDEADVAQPQPRRSTRLRQTDTRESEGAPEDMAVDEPVAVSKGVPTPVQRSPGGSAYAGRFSRASQVPLRFDYVAVPPLPLALKQAMAGPGIDSPYRTKKDQPAIDDGAANTVSISPCPTDTPKPPKRKRKSSPNPSSTPLARPPSPSARLAKKSKMTKTDGRASSVLSTPDAPLPHPPTADSRASGKPQPAAKGKGKAAPITKAQESPAKAAHHARNAYASDVAEFVEGRRPQSPDAAAEEYLAAWSQSFDFISGPPGQPRRQASGAYTHALSERAPTPSPIGGSPSRTPEPSPCPPRGRAGPLLDLRNVAKTKHAANISRSLATNSGLASRSARTSRNEPSAPIALTSKQAHDATPRASKPAMRLAATVASTPKLPDNATPRARKPFLQSPAPIPSTSKNTRYATPLDRSPAPAVFELFTPSSTGEESGEEDAESVDIPEEGEVDDGADDTADPAAAASSKREKGKQKARGAIPDDIRQEGEQLGMNYMREVYALAHRAGKDPIDFMKIVGWMHPDHCQSRERSVRNKFCSAYAFEREGPAGSRNEVKLEAEGVFDQRVKELTAELGHEPSQLELAEHFARELRLAEWIRDQNAKAGTAGVRRRRLINTTSKFTRIATAQELTDGMTVFGWVVDTHAREGQAAGAMLFGAGEAFEAIMKDYGGELRPLADKMTAKLRDCQMSSRDGWMPGDPLPGLPAPKNNSGPNAFSTEKYGRNNGGRENRSDWAWRVLRMGLRADIGRMSKLVGQSAGRKSKPGDIPGQMNFRQNATLCYEWEMELVNWSPVLMDAMPMVIPMQANPVPDGHPLDENDAIAVAPTSLADIKQSPEDFTPLGKPASEKWAEVADSMRQKRVEAEEEIIKKDLGLQAAFEVLRAMGAPAFLPILREDLEGKELAEMGDTPMVTDGAGNTLLTWRDGPRRWLEDALNGADTRVKWQSWRSDTESAGPSTAKQTKAGKQRSKGPGRSRSRASKKQVKSKETIDDDEDIDHDKEKELMEFLMMQKHRNMRTQEDLQMEWRRANAYAGRDAGIDDNGEMDDEEDAEDSGAQADAQDADYEEGGDPEHADDDDEVMYADD